MLKSMSPENNVCGENWCKNVSKKKNTLNK